ncbi:uncharacterized protein LOC107262320 isoform X2 [Ricinus communis]|uniref:uncharacterized protein LOC107262320 isoform X2 n=1 Tax=Ricinus communis TaxID=3988 RepID=UPI0007726C73|nr:uncharacterized protein LOC107262320 isoform X2 [Ricinus communis]|eukprot:XP_015583009.1 uncharacterized protein LOC107262320 isoform X1 [Ricinus communis]
MRRCIWGIRNLMVEKNTKKIEVDMAQESREERESDDDYELPMQPNSKFLSELNLIVMVLSLYSLSSEEDCMSCTEEEETKSTKDKEAKAEALSRSHARNRYRDRDIHEFRPLARRAQRFQPMIKDSRHGRKM